MSQHPLDGLRFKQIKGVVDRDRCALRGLLYTHDEIKLRHPNIDLEAAQLQFPEFQFVGFAKCRKQHLKYGSAADITVGRQFFH